MRVKFPNGFETNLPHEIGASFVAAGMATEIVPEPPKQTAAAPSIHRLSPWAANVTAKKPQPGDRSLKTVTSSVSYEREIALEEKTKDYRPKKRNGFNNQQISVGDLCVLLGVSPLQLEQMSAERLKHLCVDVPSVPDSVSGAAWAQTPYRYEEFMGKRERWIDFLYRIGVSAPTLLTWERSQVAARVKPMSAEQAIAFEAVIIQQMDATNIVAVD